MTLNLNVNIVPSYCYEDAELNCRQYGRLYTWDSAQRACQSLGDGWRLPVSFLYDLRRTGTYTVQVYRHLPAEISKQDIPSNSATFVVTE